MSADVVAGERRCSVIRGYGSAETRSPRPEATYGRTAVPPLAARPAWVYVPTLARGRADPMITAVAADSSGAAGTRRGQCRLRERPRSTGHGDGGGAVGQPPVARPGRRAGLQRSFRGAGRSSK